MIIERIKYTTSIQSKYNLIRIEHISNLCIKFDINKTIQGVKTKGKGTIITKSLLLLEDSTLWNNGNSTYLRDDNTNYEYQDNNRNDNHNNEQESN